MVSSTDPRHRPHSIEGLTKPDPREYASQIVAWAICWPWNLVWTLCVNNPFRYLLEFVFFEIRAAFDEISSGQFESIEKDLLLDDSPVPKTQPAYQSYQHSSSIDAPPPAPLTPPVTTPPVAAAPVVAHPVAAAPVAAAPVAAAPVAASPVQVGMTVEPERAAVAAQQETLATAAPAPMVAETPAGATSGAAPAPVVEPGQPAEIAPLPRESQASAPAKTPIWTPPVQRPLIVAPSPTLGELTQPGTASSGASFPTLSDVPQYPLQTAAFSSSDPAVDPQPRRSPPEIDEAGGSVATNEDPWYSTWKAGPSTRTTNNNEPRS